MRIWITGTALLALAACVGQPLDPEAARSVTSQSEVAELDPSSGEAASLNLVVPGQLVTLEHPDGQTERAWVQAQITITPGLGGAQMDGAILVVSAADGPMPQTDPDAETTSIRVRWAGVDDDGTVRFEGTAIRTVGREVSLPFDISGTARPAGAPPPQPDGTSIVWGIVGGNVQESMAFSATGTLRYRLP